ncbi:MAG TPA: hypothetical protein VL527_08660 [Dongiaceae bacterium]|jgi:hypothetical protein|nr:hypothetical protein [Dongiaceae bacterium]
MITKRILILANSIKHYPKSCIAGRELLDDQSGKARWGGWIRPVSDHDEGALDSAERRLTTGTDPKPLDIVQISLHSSKNDPIQPENWLIEPAQKWTKCSSATIQDLTPLLEEPHDLWLQPRQQNDRVHVSFLLRTPQLRSLYLIEPDQFCFEVRSKTWNNETKKKIRAGFSYKGQYYSLALEDPLIVRKYFPDFSKANDGDLEIKHRVVLCVSLPQEFKEYKEPGFHFKVVATVFELPK